MWLLVKSEHTISQVREAIFNLWVFWWSLNAKQSGNCTFKDVLPECVVTLAFKYISDLPNFRELFTTNGRKHESLALLDLKEIRENAESDINLLCYLVWRQIWTTAIDKFSPWVSLLFSKRWNSQDSVKITLMLCILFMERTLQRVFKSERFLSGNN